MLFPIHPFGPNESVSPESIKIDNRIYVTFDGQPVLGHVRITKKRKISRAFHMDEFTHIQDRSLKGQTLDSIFQLPIVFIDAIDRRFNNESCERISIQLRDSDNMPYTISLSTYTKRRRPPGKLRLVFRKKPVVSKPFQIVLAPQQDKPGDVYVVSGQKLWDGSSVEKVPFFRLWVPLVP